MNEQWKRLIEAERRLARLESTLQRQNTRIVSVNGAVRNDATDVRNPFGSGGGGGGGATPRFPTEFEMWVEWDTVPTLKTAASSNVPADGPALDVRHNLKSTCSLLPSQLQLRDKSFRERK
jgi:hypothetical protein